MASVPFHVPATPGLTTPAVQAALLKEISKQLAGSVGGDVLQVGQVVQAKIATDADGKPTLMLGGVKVPAQLPGDVVPGQLLRLQVKESSPERVLLQIVKDSAGAPAVGGAALSPAGAASASAATAATSDPASAQGLQQAQGPAAQAAATAVPWAVIPMPGGAQARVWLDPDGGGEDAEGPAQPRRRSMVIRYDSPVLGRTDVVLNLDPGQLDATVLAPAGDPLDLIRKAVPDLRLALAGAVERPVAVVTGGRGHDEVDLRA